MSKSKSKKAIILAVGGFLVGSTIIGLIAGFTIKNQNDKLNQNKKLYAAQTEAAKTINDLVNLKREQVDHFNSQIKISKSSQNIESVLNQAKQLDTDNKVNKQKEANDLIKRLSDLESAQIQQFHNQINQSKSIKDIDVLLNQAKLLNLNNKTKKQKEEFVAQKNNYKSKLDTLANLTLEQKEQLTKQINRSDSLQELNLIWNNAQKLEQNNSVKKQQLKELLAKKETIKQSLDQLTSLDSEQMKEFKNQVEKTNSSEKLNQILETASKADKKAKETAYNEFTNTKNKVNLYIANSLKDSIYRDGKNELESKIKMIEDTIKNFSNQKAFSYKEAKDKLEEVLANAKKHVELVNTANKDENKLKITRLKLDYYSDKNHNILVVIEGKNIDSRFNKNPSAKLLIKNSKKNIEYFNVNFPKYIARGVLVNNDTKIDFGASIGGRANTSGDVEIDKIVLISDKEYHNIDLKGKSLKFNGTTVDKTIDALKN